MGALASALMRANVMNQSIRQLANANQTARRNTGGPGNFDGEAYLRANPDVAANPVFRSNPFAHYAAHGQFENRNLGVGNFDGAAYLRANPDVAVDPMYVTRPFQHFLDEGMEQGRDLGTNPRVNTSRQANPELSAGFNEGFYLATNPDVAAAVSRGDFSAAYEHDLLYGSREGRSPNQTIA